MRQHSQKAMLKCGKTDECLAPRFLIRLLFALFLFAWPFRLAASEGLENQAAICEEAGAYAASRVGIPFAVMQALTRTETGRRLNGEFLPWPWTVNMEGQGKWFGTPAEALTFATENFDRGARSFDVGCFQVNYKWHGEAFASIEDMFDPYQNALYAAQFMASLYAELGSWTAAAGAYHSRTPEYAAKYSARFSQILERMDGTPGLGQTDFLGEPQTEFAALDTPPTPREFAPLIPVQNLTGSLFVADGGAVPGLLLAARGSLLRPN